MDLIPQIVVAFIPSNLHQTYQPPPLNSLMSIHILSRDKAVVSQLTEVFKKLGETACFYSDLKALKESLPNLSKSDSVFYDLQLENEVWAFASLYIGCRNTHLIVFEPKTAGMNIEENSENRTDGEHYLLLPKNPARALARVKETLRELIKGPYEKIEPLFSQKEQSAAKVQTAQTEAPQISKSPTHSRQTKAQYLFAKSDAMQNFIAQMKASRMKSDLVILEGEDGAEFELAARELNFISNEDHTPLIMLDLNQHNFDELKNDLTDTEDTQQARYCYIGLTSDLTSTSSQNLDQLIGILEDSQDTYPNLHLIVGHVIDSEDYISNSAKNILAEIRIKAVNFKIPDLAERTADISNIASSIFSTLRMVHPFVIPRTLSRKAIQYLESQSDTLNYSAIIRVLRNAIALSHKEILDEDQIKSFSDNSQTTRHLVESMADEVYFNANEEALEEIAHSEVA